MPALGQICPVCGSSAAADVLALPGLPIAINAQVRPDQALSVFPPANSEGAYEARLPQIVLKKKTLPWDRAAAPTGTVFNNQTVADHTPWLTLVVIARSSTTSPGRNA